MKIKNFEDLGAFIFSSADSNGKIGSIYFQNGRIRLVHSDGPLIESYEKISYFIVNEKADGDILFKAINKCKSSNIADIAIAISKSKSVTFSKYVCDKTSDPNDIRIIFDSLNRPDKYAIFEVHFSTNGEYIGTHLSRGMFSFCTPEVNMEDLFKIVLNKSNTINTLGNRTSHFIRKMNQQLYDWINVNSKLKVYNPYEV